jgi:peroxiredoxin
LYEKYKDNGLVVLGISLDRTDIETVKEYVEEMQLTFPTLHDPTGNIGAPYAVRGVPSTYFIDRQGYAIGAVVGPRQWDGEEVDRLANHLLQSIPKE